MNWRDVPKKNVHVSSRLSESIGLTLGQKIGRIDATTQPTTSDKFDKGEWDALHRRLVVVDSYSAAVDLDELQRGRVNVVIQTLGAEEMLLCVAPEDDEGLPPPGLKIWKHVFEGADLIERVSQVIDEHLRFVQAYEDYIGLALSEDDVRRLVSEGKAALVLMLVSGLIANDLDVLRKYYDLGIRAMALCHLGHVDWADSTAELKETPGLTPFGRDVVKACQDWGILVDLSHASDQTCWDALEVATKPIMATHTKCRVLTHNARDLSDELIGAIADTGGVVGILAPAPKTAEERGEYRLQRDRRLMENYADPFELAAAKLADAETWGTKLDLESIDHAVNVAGIDHVGLASHFQNVPQWREFTAALMEHGYREEEAAKILGENHLRVMRETIDR
jgi:membrane dipeptidase